MKLTGLVAVIMLGATACGLGEMGPLSPQGSATGLKGDPSIVSAGIVRRQNCAASQRFGTAIISGLHSRYDFADGSAFIVCFISGQDNVRRDSFPFFALATDSQEDMECTVNFDVETNGGSGIGFFRFEVDTTSKPRMIYRDSSSVYNDTTTILTCEVF